MSLSEAKSKASSKAHGIISRTNPARKADQIRRILADIEAMREAYLTYGQIVPELAKEYGIAIRPEGDKQKAARHLAAIVWKVRRCKKPIIPLVEPESQPRKRVTATESAMVDLDSKKAQVEESRKPRLKQ